MSEPPPPGYRYFQATKDASITLVPDDDGRPDPCKFYGVPGHDPQACVDCIRARAVARQIALGAADDGSGWEPESLADADPVPEPTILRLGEGYLLRRGWVTLIHGAFGSGKTPLTYLAVVEQVQAGNLALIVDHEMGKPQAKALLLELGLTYKQLDEGVLFLDQPPPLTDTGRDRLVSAVEATGRDLAVVVIDSLTESLTTVPGLSDNDSIDVAKWAQELPGWLRDQFEAGVVVIDHSGVEDSPRPSGSHKKREFPQFHLWCRKDTPFSRDQPNAGRSSLLVMKDRSGDRPIKQVVATLRTNERTFYLAPAEGTKPGEIELPLDKQPEDSTLEDLYAALLEAGEAGILKTALCGSGSRGQWRRNAVKVLVAEERAIERPDGASSTARRLWADESAPG